MNVRKVLALGPRGWVELMVLLALAVYVEVGVRLLPLHLVARSLRLRVGGPAPVGRGRRLNDREKRQRSIVWMLERHWRFADRTGLCLRRSLLLGWINRDRDPVLRLGVARIDGRVSAHAWLEYAGGQVGRDGVHREFPLA